MKLFLGMGLRCAIAVALMAGVWGFGPCAAFAAESADFTVSDLAVQTDGFIHVRLQNLSAVDISLTTEIKESIFLAVWINGTLRAEYKVRHLDPNLFKKHSSIWFRTNFRPPADGESLVMKVAVNGGKVIPETNWNNNQLEKQVRK